MPSLENRVAQLESKQASADLTGITDDELDAYLGQLKAGTSEWFRVLLTGISRKGSRLPISTNRKHSVTSSTGNPVNFGTSSTVSAQPLIQSHAD